MLSDRDWVRLVQGLSDATRSGRLEWSGEGGASSLLSTALGPSYLRTGGSKRVRLEAAAGRAMYEISAADGGLAPHGIRVWEKVGVRKKEVGSIESTVDPLAMRTGINDALKRLWDAAAETVEPGDVIVDRLLGDLYG